MDSGKHRKAYSKQEYLPKKLVTKLQDGIFNNNSYEYRTKNNFLQCVSIIHYHQIEQGFGLNNYVPLGRNYWKKIYGGNYHERVIEPLLKIGLIESSDFGYRTFPDKKNPTQRGKENGSVGIRYCINPDLLDDEYSTISYITKGNIITSLEFILFGKDGYDIATIPNLDFRVSIDHQKAVQWVNTNAERICDGFIKRDYINNIPENLWIEYRHHITKEGNWSYNSRYNTIKGAKFIAQRNNQELFYFKDTFYVADIDEFMKQRVHLLKYHYTRQIQQIGVLPIEEKRHNKTLRIYSILTNFPSKILQFIQINNKTIVQLDLRTSQFLIFSNLLNVYITKGEKYLLSLFKQKQNVSYLKRLIRMLNKHHEQLPEVGVDINDITSGENSSSDVTKFIRDVFFTDFYSVVQQELGLKERSLAKHVLFRLLFKRTNRPDALLNKLSQRYPVVMSIIAMFKEKDKLQENKNQTTTKNDDQKSNFSIFLSCIEGEIFVDNILSRLRDQEIPCFTRHDSIVVARGHEDKAEEIARGVFNDFGFKYNHKSEDKFWEAIDYDEFEDSTYQQWLLDEDILSYDYS